PVVQTGDGTRRRIDVAVGHVVIEVKKNLNSADLPKAVEQLAGYVKQRAESFGRCVGILTDGSEWRLYQLHDGTLELVSILKLTKRNPDTEGLLVWIESVLSTRDHVKPTPQEIERLLGAKSPANRLDTAELRDLYQKNADHKDIVLKRQIWAKLLRTAFGAEFKDTEDLFVNHTLLVVTAELIAHAVLGFDVGPTGPLTARQIVSGTEFSKAKVRGVVEADFFDWVVDTPLGDSFVRNLGRRIARFDWAAVEHDVLKVLYESVIDKEVRESLGEYYTPDWLAERMVESFITDPLNSVVCDPSCGSGTFLFHALRQYLRAAAEAGDDTDEAVQRATAHVVGIDVHPVAVTLARVTYLLALGRDNINSPRRKDLTIPVYLGDSIQWKQESDILSSTVVRVSTSDRDLVDDDDPDPFAPDLVFPRSVLHDASRFDYLVSEMSDKAAVTTPADADQVALVIVKKQHIDPKSPDGEILRETFANMCKLNAQGRDHIWGYYVRNLIRPLWLAEPENRVDALIGNPPWLRYSKMTPSMQQKYLALARPRNLLTGALGASARDLSMLFVVRCVELYLRQRGSFAFVMPHGILTRKPHTGFRTGDWSTPEGNHLTVQFGVPWDLSQVTTGFPMTSCVIHGRRAVSAVPLPEETVTWEGYLSRPDIPWSEAKKKIVMGASKVAVLMAGVKTIESPYKDKFRQGAILVPRALMFVVDAPATPLGPGQGRRSVTSFRNNLEKKPWKDCKSITANVEKKFIRPVYLGETVLPFRTAEPREAVLPLTDAAIMTADEIALHDGLSEWWSEAENIWEKHRASNETKPLCERMDYLGQLSAELPTAPIRVVYPKSGSDLVAAIVRDVDALIDHKLYWMPTTSTAEAHYLCSILNSAPLLTKVQPLQAIGLFGARDFDKNVFAVPFPLFDPDIETHVVLADLGERAEQAAATVDISGAGTFQAQRKLVRAHLVETGIEAEIVAAVTQLLLGDTS
ncbi:MAG: N-6 DNA methylase, partial [Candidatus Nanopelagicales bacterium]